MNPREPVRLLESDSEDGAGLRELLGAARLDEPSPEQLAALAGRLGPLLEPGAGAPQTPAAPETGAAPAVTSGLKAKVLTGVAMAVLAGGSFQAGRVFEREQAPVRSEEPMAMRPSPAPEPARVEAAPTPPPPPAPTEAPVEAAAPRANAAPAPRVPRAKTPESPAPTSEARAPMDEELALLESAYHSLQSGDAAGALAEAEKHAARFPTGALAQEREVLAIDALVRMGRRDEAGARAEAFRARYPTSTHWIRIQGLLSGANP